jgi:hypothetical protein
MKGVNKVEGHDGHTQIKPLPLRGGVLHKWWSHFIEADLDSTLTMPPLINHALAKREAMANTVSSPTSVRRGWVDPLYSTHYRRGARHARWLAVGAEEAYAALEAGAQVLFSRFRSRFRSGGGGGGGGDAHTQHLSTPVKLKNVEVHIIPPGNHSFELM